MFPTSTKAFLDVYSARFGADVARYLAAWTRDEREGRVIDGLYSCALSRFDGDPDREMKAAVALLALGTAKLVGRSLDFSEMSPTEDRDWAHLAAGRDYLERLGISAWAHRKVRWVVFGGEILAEIPASSPRIGPYRIRFWSGLSRYERELVTEALYRGKMISLDEAGTVLAAIIQEEGK